LAAIAGDIAALGADHADQVAVDGAAASDAGSSVTFCLEIE
jgi:hypothetical protein